MSYATFAKTHFPLTHPRPIFKKKKPKKRRETISGFHRGDRVQHNTSGTLGTVQQVRGLEMYVRFDDGSRGHYFTANWSLVNP